MKSKSRTYIQLTKQKGTALFTSLIILVAVTILTLGSLGTSMMELQMASNSESSMQSFQLAQAAIDEIVHNSESNFVVVGALGDTVCYNSSNSDCVDDRTITFSAADDSIVVTLPHASASHTIEIERTSDEICPPRSKSSSSSCDKVKAANFDIYAESTIYSSRAQIHQGFIKLLPSTGQSLSRVPDSSSTN